MKKLHDIKLRDLEIKEDGWLYCKGIQLTKGIVFSSSYQRDQLERAGMRFVNSAGIIDTLQQGQAHKVKAAVLVSVATGKGMKKLREISADPAAFATKIKLY